MGGVFLPENAGPDRGFQENIRTESVSVKLDVSRLSEEQLRRIASGESVAAVVAEGSD